MKTSNKILAGFFILIFLIPVFVLMSFNSRIKKGQFTVVNQKDNWSNGHKAPLLPYKIVKITGPAIPGVFTCNIIPADSASYEDFDNHDEQDSIEVRQQGDTLFVNYKGPVQNHNNTSSYSHSTIDLYLPVMHTIIADGADVKLDSVTSMANPEISFQLFNQATLKLAEADNETPDVAGTVNRDTAAQPGSMLNSIDIKADNATIIVGQRAWIKSLGLQLKGASTISVHNQSHIGQLSGVISDSSTVNGNWKNLRKLATLSAE